MYYATSKVPRTLLMLTQCILRQVQVQTVGTTGRELKLPVAVTTGAASAAGARAKYISTCAGLTYSTTGAGDAYTAGASAT